VHPVGSAAAVRVPGSSERSGQLRQSAGTASRASTWHAAPPATAAAAHAAAAAGGPAGTGSKGKRPEGKLLSAKLQQGAHAEASVSLAPGACYTVVGFGAPGVFQYQINLITAPPLPPQVLAQSDADGNDPAVGPGDQCIKNPYPLPMQVKVDMHLVKGQGLVGAQLYRK